ncbi:MAG: cell division protein ZapE [Alphaproteobacteria bacterium]|nr:cell division protein ZapE [Alphaproteobacteria bacterium]
MATASPLARFHGLVRSKAIHPDPAQEAAARALDRLATQLRRYRPRRRGLFSFGSPAPAPKGLYLWGGVGRGKSMLMDLFFDTVRFEPRRRVHFHAFMLEVHEMVRAWRAKQPGDPLPRVARDIAQDAGLLCFDEFHVTDIADAMILGRLFEALFKEGVVVVATSNRAPDTLYENGINRQLFLPFIALLKSRVDVLHVDGPLDYRLARMKGFSTYYTPLGPESQRGLDEAWDSLTDGAAGTRDELMVQGRTLVVPAQAKGVARFSFTALCETPLGAADYLAIARTYHTLILSDIPQMGPEKRNAAKRFVTLIDVLYEERVKLVCSAATAPDALYQSGDGSFEFARTSSRLIEMQSEDYLKSEHGAHAG